MQRIVLRIAREHDELAVAFVLDHRRARFGDGEFDVFDLLDRKCKRFATVATARRASATHSGARRNPQLDELRAGARPARSYQRLHCRILAIEDAENLYQSRDIEDLFDLRIRADEVNRAAVLAHALEAADQHAEPGRVDIPHLFQVDDQIVDAAVDQFADRILDLGRRVDVDLAGELDDVTIAAALRAR